MKTIQWMNKLQIWQVIVLIELIIVLALGAQVNQKKKAVALQNVVIKGQAQQLAFRDDQIKKLSQRLASVMTLLQNAAEEINKQGLGK